MLSFLVNKLSRVPVLLIFDVKQCNVTVGLLILVMRKSGAGFHSLTLAPDVSFESVQKNHCVQSPGLDT